MPLEWSEDLSVGVKEIDNQHKELFNRINDLHAAMNQGRGREVITELIKFLEEYVVIHFGTEEKYMTRYAYPEYPSHKKQHEWFTKELSDTKNKLKEKGPAVHIVVHSNYLLYDWWVNHIKKIDKALGIFLMQKLRKS